MTGAFRLGVDAGNLVRDRRGMGRLARAVLREAERDATIELTLLAASRRDRGALRDEFPHVAVAAPRTAAVRNRYDALWYPFNGMRFRAAAPSLVLLHDVFAFTEPHPERIARHRERAPIARAARDATAIVTTTEWNRAEISRELGVAADRIGVVRPEPDAFFEPGADDRVPAELARRRYVLAVGGGEARKNLAMLIDACAVALSGPDECLVIVGTTNEADRRRAAASGLHAMTVDASDAMLRALYRGAALVAVPSRAEGFGLVAVEAMACGAPVLAADGSGLREATRGAACVLPADEPARWARALREILDDGSARARLAERGRAAFATSDRSAHARGILAALRRVGADARI